MEVLTVKCDVCDQEVANSEELKAHKEREHPEKRDDDDGGVTMPESEDQEQPEPVFRPVR